MSIIVPPGGFAGYSQMTGASRVALSPGGVSRSGGRRRRKAKKTSGRRRTRRARKSTGRKIKFGSPAWRKKYKLGKKRRG